MDSEVSKKKFQILSLDGGGIKGVFTAAILAQLEEDLKTKITNHFDLIAGTSTGGIIALGLGLGLSPKQILDFYIKEGKNIFGWPRARSLHHFIARKYSRSNLEAALNRCFPNKKLGDSKKRLVIPSYSLTENDIYLLKTAHSKKLIRDYKLSAVDVALATSAAPTYFSSHKNISNNRLIDGGVWANNPTLVAITEAIGFLDVNINDISVLSIGTTLSVKKHSSFLDWGGKLSWASTAPELILDGQSTGAYTQAKILLGKDRILRVNPLVPDGEFSLDKVKATDLMGKAAHICRGESEKIKAMFLNHIADEFTPDHKEIVES